ncbi:MAG: hypothetical protein HC783_01725 [Rhodobacteraceae bacterium]|nr:hypothetical protein [Paracoccaceae bacterium]
MTVTPSTMPAISRVAARAVTLRFALWLFVALAVVSVAIKFTGDFAAERVGALPDLNKALIEQHEESADQATTGVFFMGIVGAVALILSRGGRATPKLVIGFARVAGVGDLCHDGAHGEFWRTHQASGDSSQCPAGAMSKLAWYWHRLRAMSPGEVALHVRKKLRQDRAEGRRISCCAR